MNDKQLTKLAHDLAAAFNGRGIAARVAFRVWMFVTEPPVLGLLHLGVYWRNALLVRMGADLLALRVGVAIWALTMTSGGVA